MSLRRAIPLSCLALACLLACAGPPQTARLPDAALLSGATLFGEALRPGELPQSNVLALDAEMRAFVAARTGNASHAESRMRRLLRGMADEGLLNLDYELAATRSARQTFRARSGNCLSFTILFVALAREAGLDAGFQLLDIPPVWTGGTGTVWRSNHITAVVRNVRKSAHRQRSYTVDFNNTQFGGNHSARQVSDGYAIALYHSNLAAEALAQQKRRSAFAHLWQAVQSHPNVPGAWSNLGVLYARSGALRLAEACYLRALQSAPKERSAMLNLASLYERQGRGELAEYYRRRVRFHQRRNPYYHYWLAERALGEARVEDSLRAIRRAIRLQEDEHQFHSLAGVIHHRAGNPKAAQASFQKAAAHAGNEKLRRRYNLKRAALER